MKKIKEQVEKDQAGKGKLKAEILKLIVEKEKNGSANLSQLIQLGSSRSAVKYHIKRLYEEKKIRAFVKGAGLKDDEIFYSIVLDNYPQTIHEIKGLIEPMCKEDRKVAAPAYEHFINRCAESGIPTDDAEKLAYDLISGLHPRLKELMVFELSYNNDWRGIGNYNPETKRWEGGQRDYKYFISQC